MQFYFLYLIVFLTVGYLHTEPCHTSSKLERSIASLLSNIDESSLKQLSIIVVLRNCSTEYTFKFLKKIHQNHDRLLKHKILKIIKSKTQHISNGLKSKYWNNLTSYDMNYTNKAKSLVTEMQLLWKYSITESYYFIQFTDHVIVQGNIISHLLEFRKTLTNNRWLWADNIEGVLSLSSRFYQTNVFPSMIEYMELTGNQMPVNIILLFYRQFKYSHVVINISPPLPLRDEYYFIADNPPAKLTTSLNYGGGYNLQDVYNIKRGYFWAKTPRNGDYIIIDLKDAVEINRILVETGSHMDEDIIPGGSLSVVFQKKLLLTTNTDCYSSTYTKLSDFTSPSVNLQIKNRSVKCIKITIVPVPLKDLQFWVIFKTIAIFTDHVKNV